MANVTNSGFRYQTGAILPVVLWVVIVCLVVSASYASNVRLAVKTMANTRDNLLLKYAARSGIYLALNKLIRENGSITAKPDWDVNESIDGMLLRVSITTEDTKLSINHASEFQLSEQLQRSGIDTEKANILAQRIMDWRDPDNSRRAQGMEDSDYYDSGHKYGAKDSAFSDLTELLLIKGIDESNIQQLKNQFTVYPAGANKIYRITSHAKEEKSNKSTITTAIVQLTNNPFRPYRFLKWSQGVGKV